MKFKNIIFYNTTAVKSTVFRKQLEHIKFIRIFVTSVIDEVQQIIDQSERAVILVDDEINANKFFKATLHKKRAEFKKYYLNWDMILAPAFRLSLKEQAFGVINTDDVDAAIERVELYLFGKANVFKNPSQDPGPYVKQSLVRKAFFTHIEKIGKEWKVMATSHEPEDSINEILGLDWQELVESYMREAKHMKSLFERRLLNSRYHEIVYPHMVNGEVIKLSIVHVFVGEDYATNIIKVQSFLTSIA